MAKMRVVQLSRPNGPFELVERELVAPGPRMVRVKVQACGICHSDTLSRSGDYPGLRFPLVPGHEIAGVVDAIGPQVDSWTVGQRVGVGWHGGYCGDCEFCRRGQFFACVKAPITGVTCDGGYGEYAIVSARALALLPDGLTPVEAAPLMCAGVTTFNALRHSGARPGELVAVLGLGGLGHLGVQFAAKFGFQTVAIARGRDKEPLARQLGARHYIDSRSADPAAELTKLGGARVILATVTNAAAMEATLGGLAVDGTFLILGVGGPLKILPFQLIAGCRAVKGWYSGTAIDSQDTAAFSALTGVRSMNEVFPLERVAEAYERMLSGHARFRVVLTMGK